MYNRLIEKLLQKLKLHTVYYFFYVLKNVFRKFEMITLSEKFNLKEAAKTFL